MNNTLKQLDDLINARLNSATADESYVAQLSAKGINKVLEKVGEESTEFILAAKDVATDGEENVIDEAADLLFHTMLSLANLGISTEQVVNRLGERMNISGLDEKASRLIKE